MQSLKDIRTASNLEFYTNRASITFMESTDEVMKPSIFEENLNTNT
jgi:hypothetical protein